MIVEKELKEIGFIEIESNYDLWYSNGKYEIIIKEGFVKFIIPANEMEMGLNVNIKSVLELEKFLSFLE